MHMYIYIHISIYIYIYIQIYIYIYTKQDIPISGSLVLQVFKTLEPQVQAVESGYWPLYRYNPDKAGERAWMFHLLVGYNLL